MVPQTLALALVVNDLPPPVGDLYPEKVHSGPPSVDDLPKNHPVPQVERKTIERSLATQVVRQRGTLVMYWSVVSRTQTG